MTTPQSALNNAFTNQDVVFSSAFSILHNAIAQHAFPSASIAVTHRASLIALKALGRFTYSEKIDAGAPTLSRPLRQGGDSDLESINTEEGAPFLASFARRPDLSL